ncbi:replication factor C subunit 1 (RFC1) [Vairimorpha necatrix]|uniref:Replication factor C subunit 1 n=1 Tax=Vairimorpha necatrix TaxID=6039 RepID=A0AAX4JG98_9MICR
MENFFKGKTFVFTGELTMDREYAKSKVILLGGRVTTAPSGKTDFLIVGADPGPLKLKKARELGIQIIYEKEFTKNLEEGEKAYDKSIDINEHYGGMVIEENQISSDFDETSVFDTFGENKPTKPSKFQEMWSEKYRPKKRSEIVGNQTVLSSLEDFLKGKSNYKGALLSGSPGVGKTTAVHVLCKELGLKLIEFNASDVRNKNLLLKKLKGLTNTKGISKNMKLQKKVILMDEVDGMTSDRGGLLELNTLIKNSEIPFVCICNDRNNLKIRTLANNCLDLKFRRLDARQILPRIKDILKRENKVIGDNILNEIVLVSHGDIRYILNSIQRICLNDKIKLTEALDLTKKTILKNIFDIAQECFHKKSINEKTNLYFEDYSLVPLFISENYMKMNFRNMKDFLESADSISNGDVVEKLIRGSTQEWSLAPLHGFFTVALPTRNKTLSKRIDFPGWLGQNSRYLKYKRNLKDLCLHTFRKIQTGLESFRLYESNLLFTNFISSLKKDKVKEALDLVVEYDLVKEDMINLSEIVTDGQVLYKQIKTKTKSDFTRQYNKLRRQLPYNNEEVKKAKEVNEESNEEY